MGRATAAIWLLGAGLVMAALAALAGLTDVLVRARQSARSLMPGGMWAETFLSCCSQFFVRRSAHCRSTMSETGRESYATTLGRYSAANQKKKGCRTRNGRTGHPKAASLGLGKGCPSWQSQASFLYQWSAARLLRGETRTRFPQLSETLPTAVEVTSMAPSVMPGRTGVRIHGRSRIHARCP
jgi:hypothetical protein